MALDCWERDGKEWKLNAKIGSNFVYWKILFSHKNRIVVRDLWIPSYRTSSFCIHSYRSIRHRVYSLLIVRQRRILLFRCHFEFSFKNLFLLIHADSRFTMAFLYNIPEDPIPHHYKTFFESLEIQNEACQRASTVYVGNFIWNTTKEQLFYYFSSVGNVKNVYMGLDKNKYQPCGFAFVVYCSRSASCDPPFIL